ncbi:hypothetical protein L202_05227 [Cryptococcus amylolentus CBS 6039]|uniref:Uncharacterized protein n=1 Tax=Cryptococcus amylolentus CBS 6039 TaxID=1295533 RepID=A0A1E3HLI0_9TREE|nr:hypothetical protein L202_05227 [Cryptococcus amylolentus CBS 6039]ODN76566.1 hypothetical protein L202_05227 [Cryptococcus amylolentus CBS 6039]
MSEDTASSASSSAPSSPSPSDLSHFSDYSDSSRNSSDSESDSDSDSDDVPRAFKDLPIEFDSALLERDLSKYVPPGCAALTRPVWPDTGFVGEYYQPVASFLNSTLDVAREAYERSDKEVEYCALDFLFTKAIPMGGV